MQLDVGAFVNVADQVAQEVANNQLKSQINGQMTTIGVGQGGQEAKNINQNTQTPSTPPIFWEEEGFPDIEYWDNEYADLVQFDPLKVRYDNKYPNHRFLVLHYLGNLGSREDKNNDAMKTNKGNLADRSKQKGNIDRHEVPYASTIEGGKNALTFPASASQNQAHGRALFQFYRKHHFIGGEEFWVPLPKYSQKRIPVPSAQPNLIPRSKPIGGYPGQGIGNLISDFIKWLTGKRIRLPDPIPAPIPSPVPVPIPFPR